MSKQHTRIDMPTLAEITLRLAREITDVIQSTGTAGAATSLTDTVRLTQPAEHWAGGTLWILSGTHIGKFVMVDDFAANVLGFATFGTTIGTPSYAVASKRFPLDELKKCVNRSLQLENVKVLTSNTTLIGDGSTLEFTLPTGVSNVRKVLIKDTSSPAQVYPSHHWREELGKLIFDTGYPPCDDYTIDLRYRARHAELTVYSSELNAEVDEDWLHYKAVENLMLWALDAYGDSPEKKFARKLQWALEMNKDIRPLRSQIDIVMRTS
jgi:hypothetical protein